MDNLLTAKQAAKALGVNLSTVTRYKRSGLLPTIRLGSKVRFPRESVEQFGRERDQGFSANDLKGDVAVLKQEMARMKRLMDFLLLKLGLRDERWYLSDSDLVCVSNMCGDVPRQVSYKHGNVYTILENFR